MRDLRAFIERTKMVLLTDKGQLLNAPVQSDFISEVERVKGQFADVYPVDQWMRPTILEKVKKWSDSETRRELLIKDRELRKAQGRVRGEGPDILIGPEESKKH